MPCAKSHFWQNLSSWPQRWGWGKERLLLAQLLSQTLRESIMQVFKLKSYKIDLFCFTPTPTNIFGFSSPVMCLLHFHLSVTRQLSFWLHYKTKSCGYYFCVMPGSNELGLSGDFRGQLFLAPLKHGFKNGKCFDDRRCLYVTRQRRYSR